MEALAHPEKKLHFRSFAWTGDEVAYRLRPEGYAAYMKALLKERPAKLVIVGFGMNEAFAGAAGFLDPQAPSLPRQLQAAGYATGHFGKWHLGGGRDVEDAPKLTAYGFDEYASTWESPEPHPDIEGRQPKVPRWERTAYFVDRTLDFLRRHRDQPCFVQLWPDDIHTPWVPDGPGDD